MRPACSVLVLFHNGIGLLRGCLQSLKHSLRVDDEVIVAINTRNRDILNISIDDHGITVIRDDRDLGYAAAANWAARNATKNWFVFCDHDLVFEPNWLDRLWDAQYRDPQIGATSCKLINTQTGRVLDYGIAYSEFNGAHPHIDLPTSHPLVCDDRIAQAICTGGMLISRNLFEAAGGFDEKLGNFYCDVDLCFQLKRLGKKVETISSAQAFHFGGDFSSIDRGYKSSTLKADIKGYFYAKNADILKVDLHTYFQKTSNYLKSGGFIYQKYIACQLMNVTNPDWYVRVTEDLGASYYDVLNRPTGHRDSGVEGLFEVLGFDLLTASIPIAYFVDRFISLQQNRLWWSRRNADYDIVVDRNANIVPVRKMIMGTEY